MKKLILSSLLAVAAVSASAAEASITYTYAGNDLLSWGRFKAETYDVAIRLNDPALVGKKITSLRAVLNASEGIESTSLWLSKELKLENIDGVKKNVPDTYSKEVAVEKVVIPGVAESAGQLSATLDTPYEITDEGIYVGYTLIVPSPADGEVLTEEQREPVMVSPCENAGSLYVRASKDFLSWTNYSSNINASAAIYVTVEGEFAEYSVDLQKLSDVYAAAGEDFSVRATLFNIGADPISQLGYTYSIGEESFESVLDFDDPLQPHFVNPATVMLPIAAVSGLGEYTLDVNITSINGHPNGSAETSASSKLTVMSYVPVHRPMLEEFTGTWCGWCPRGMLALQLLNEEYGDNVVLAAYHTNDPMATPSLPKEIGGCPTSTLNRGALIDPFFGTSSNKTFGIRQDVLTSMETGVTAGIEATAGWADDAKTAVRVTTLASFYENKTKPGYKIGYLLVCNGITGEGENWPQSNYYASYAGTYTGTLLEPLTKLPAYIVRMQFDDVVVDVSGMMGVEGSLPDVVRYGSAYEHSFTIDISGNELVQDKGQVYAVAFILNPDGTILNSVKVKVGEDSGVDRIPAGSIEKSAEYYNLSGLRVSTPQHGVFLKVSRMADGSVKTSKVILK